jgi:E1A/CREB-binding protein
MAAFVKQRSILLQRGFHHLLQTLGEPRTPERERQIVTILHSNPLLMAAFVKQRSILLQRNQNPQL